MIPFILLFKLSHVRTGMGTIEGFRIREGVQRFILQLRMNSVQKGSKVEVFLNIQTFTPHYFFVDASPCSQRQMGWKSFCWGIVSGLNYSYWSFFILPSAINFSLAYILSFTLHSFFFLNLNCISYRVTEYLILSNLSHRILHLVDSQEY